MLRLGYLWLSGMSSTQVVTITHHAKDTVTDFFQFFRQLAADDLDEEDYKIGGPGVVVELDESKFGKRKYNRGRRTEGEWVLGGVERTEQKRFFARVVPDRSHETLMRFLKDHVAPGSIIYTDCWAGYSGCIDDLEARDHLTVNHSECFVDPVTKVHTNTIEGKWTAIKTKISKRNRGSKALEECLFEQIWRYQHKDDLWEGFLGALLSIAYN